MPQLKPKPSEIAAEAKGTYFPNIKQNFPQYPTQSYLHSDSDKIKLLPSKDTTSRRLRIAVIDGDPVDVALDWYDTNTLSGSTSSSYQPRIPLVNMAHETQVGGGWESNIVAPEENLCRRSNLVQCLNTPWESSQTPNYPIPTIGGIYSPYVVVFRSGPDRNYTIWQDFKYLPVISVAPVRRPKLNDTGEDYSFDQEKELMKEKIRTVLRIAAYRNHKELCVGAFGSGPGFQNPVHQLALMWRDVLFSEPEFQGAFTNVVFAIENPSDYEVFKRDFDPANVIGTAYM